MEDRVVIQVYRRREDDPDRWEYLDRVELASPRTADEVRAMSPDELEGLVPYPEMQERWGGGEYQCRFLAERGRGRTPLRSRNVGILGTPRGRKWRPD